MCIRSPFDKDVIHKLTVAELLEFSNIYYFKQIYFREQKKEQTMYLVNFPEFRANDYHDVIAKMVDATNKVNSIRGPNESKYQYVNQIPAYGGFMKSWDERMPEPAHYPMVQVEDQNPYVQNQAPVLHAIDSLNNSA
jgi:hypothetical protein